MAAQESSSDKNTVAPSAAPPKPTSADLEKSRKEKLEKLEEQNSLKQKAEDEYYRKAFEGFIDKRGESDDLNEQIQALLIKSVMQLAKQKSATMEIIKENFSDLIGKVDKAITQGISKATENFAKDQMQSYTPEQVFPILSKLTEDSKPNRTVRQAPNMNSSGSSEAEEVDQKSVEESKVVITSPPNSSEDPSKALSSTAGNIEHMADNTVLSPLQNQDQGNNDASLKKLSSAS